MDELLYFEPPTLSFTITLNQQTSTHLHLQNITKEIVSFKVKTTHVKRYSVKPNQAVLQPNEKLTVSFVQQMFAAPPEDLENCRDRFQLLAVPLSAVPRNAEADGPLAGFHSIAEIWAAVPPSGVVKEKLSVTLKLSDTSLLTQMLKTPPPIVKPSIQDFRTGSASFNHTPPSSEPIPSPTVPSALPSEPDRQAILPEFETPTKAIAAKALDVSALEAQVFATPPPADTAVNGAALARRSFASAVEGITSPTLDETVDVSVPRTQQEGRQYDWSPLPDTLDVPRVPDLPTLPNSGELPQVSTPAITETVSAATQTATQAVTQAATQATTQVATAAQVAAQVTTQAVTDVTAQVATPVTGTVHTQVAPEHTSQTDNISIPDTAAMTATSSKPSPWPLSSSPREQTPTSTQTTEVTAQASTSTETTTPPSANEPSRTLPGEDSSEEVDYTSTDYVRTRELQMNVSHTVRLPALQEKIRQRIAVERAGELVKVINDKVEQIDSVNTQLTEARHKLSDARMATRPAYDVRFEINESARIPIAQITIMAIISGALLQLLV